MKNFREELNKMKTEFAEKAKAEIIPAFNEIFDRYPEFNKFSWRAYVQYFNDGNECTFSSCHDYDFYINGSDENIDNLPYKSELPEHQRMRSFHKEVCDIIDNIGNELLQHLFGDHVEIIVTRNNISVEEYTDHD